VDEPVTYNITVQNAGSRREVDLYYVEEAANPCPDLDEFLSTPEKGEEKRNWFDRKMGYYRWTWLIKQRLGTVFKEIPIPSLVAGESVDISYTLVPYRRGYIRLAGSRVSKRDLFNFRKSGKVIQNEGSLLVLPKIYPVIPPQLPGSRKYNQGGVVFAQKVGNSEEFMELREYQPGDPLKHIHLKTFAKTGTPMVRQYQDEYFARYGLILDTFTSHAFSDVLEGAVSTACSSGAHGIGWAYDMIKLDRADVMVAGGTEAPLTPYTFAAFSALRVLSKRNGSPQEASRPFDKERDGFVIGEGAGTLILEELNHALKRKAHIYAEIISYALTSGAYHMVMPAPEGKDAARTMVLALKEAGLKPKDINYINAHGTSTQANDKLETKAIKEVFSNYAYKVPISSTKSMIGHTIGASGAIETIVCALTIENNLIPPTINYKYPDPDCDLDYVPNEARKSKINIAIKNSFGFGSNNVCIIIRKV